jgi:Tfp pilus assembly protein PilO
MLKKGKPLAEIAVFCAVFIAVLILIHLTLGRSLIKSTEKLRESFKTTQAKLHEAEGLIRSVPNPQKEIEEIAKKADEFKTMEMNKKQIPRIISMLGGSVEKHNITIVSMKPREDIKSAEENLPAGVTKIYVEIVLSCSYQQFGEYLDTLLRLPMSFTIESITLQKKEERPAAEQAAKTSGEKAQAQAQDLVASLLLSTYMVWQL